MNLFRTGGNRRRSRGQGLVEFALAAPLIVLLIAGILDFGRGIYTFNTVSQSVRAAARKAMVDQNKSDVRAAAIAAAPTLGLTTSNVSVCFKTQDSAERTCDFLQNDNCPRVTRMVGCLAVIQVSTIYHPFTPFISALFSQIPITATSVVAIEYVCPAKDATTTDCT
jgi:Flp pilus assembly protein TadG